MFNFSANLGFLFKELPFVERITAAARSGLRGVELPHSNVPAKEIADAVKANGLFIAQFNAPSGNEEPGVHGLCIGKKREWQFLTSINHAMDTAHVFGESFSGLIHVVAGIPEEDERVEILEARMVERVQYAADRFAEHGLTVLLEPINCFDMPGFFLHSMEQGIRMVEKIGRDNVKLQYDIYHAQRTRGDLVRFLRDHFDNIGHIQIADNPGRHQPGTGEINFPFIFDALCQLDYSGWVGLEYIPDASTATAFDWIRDMGLKERRA